jgi:hypothetical protein
MFIFLLSQLPLPIVLYLNWHVTVKFLRVRRLSASIPVEKPRRLVIGWWLSNVAIIFVMIPAISERRFFVQDHRWLLSYAIAAGLTITGLTLMNSALGEELRDLARFRRSKLLRKPVDTRPSDTV